MVRLRKKCENDFCNTCCDRSVPWVHKNHLYTCKKQCREITKISSKITNKEEKYNFINLCINVDREKTSIYSYCDDNFSGGEEMKKCKVDTCRLCCATSDQIKKFNLNGKLLSKCYEKCAVTWEKKVK